MKLAIYVRETPGYSETFLGAQLKKLEPDLVISGVPFATESIPGGQFYPPSSLGGILSFLWQRGIEKGVPADIQRRTAEALLKRRRISVLLANYGPEGLKFLPTCRALGIPAVTHFHGFDAHAAFVLREHAGRYPSLGTNGNRVVAVSEAMKEQLVGCGVPADSIFVIRYGVEPDRFPPREVMPETPVFIGVGRFTDKKAPYLTLLAFRSVVAAFPKARLILAGDGDLMEVTRNLARHYGLEDVVDFPGTLQPAEVSRQMRGATAFVQHSITPRNGPFAGDSEGTPVAILEAMMSGLPILASQHAGIPEIVRHGHTGLLFRERDVAGMASAMMALAGDRQLAVRLGANAAAQGRMEHAQHQYITSLRSCLEATLSAWRERRPQG